MKNFVHAALVATFLIALPAGAATPTAAAVPAAIVKPDFPVTATTRDGSHDFDFEFGTWRTHYRLLRHRLVGDHVWYDCYGTSVIRPFWDGSGNLEDGDLKCPNRYIGGLTLRMYDPATRQWTLWWGTRKLAIAPPPQLGHFEENGVGEFYAYDSWEGKPEITRFQWTRVNGNPHFEQAFSTDGGKTWETNWTTDYEPVSPTTAGVWNAADSVRRRCARLRLLDRHVENALHALTSSAQRRSRVVCVRRFLDRAAVLGRKRGYRRRRFAVSRAIYPRRDGAAV